MFEFPFVESQQFEGDEVEQSRYTVDRLQHLAKIAAKLQEAGCRVRFTITGLAFLPSDYLLLEGEVDFEEYPEYVADQLAKIGIDDQLSQFPRRTLAELQDAAGKLWDRVWYERKLVLVNSPEYDSAVEFAQNSDIVRGMLRNMARVEQAGLEKEFPVECDFDWGMVNGKLSALNWVFGEEWDMLDT